MFELQIRTTKETEDMLRDRPDDFRKALLKGMKITSAFLERIVKKSFGTEGRPGVRSGHLRRSIYNKAFERASNVIGVVGTEVIYGRFLEEGTKYIKKGKYTFLRPAVVDNQERIDRKITQIVAREMNK